MKILIIATQFPPLYIGGTELQAQSIAYQLSKNNCVHIVTQHDKDPSHIEKINNNLIIHRARKIRFPIADAFLTMIFNTLKISLTTHFDSFLAYTLYPSGFAAIVSAKILRRPVVVWGQGNDVYLENGLPIRLIRLIVLMFADVVIAQTYDMKKTLLKIWRFIGKLKVIPNAIDLTLFKNGNAPPSPQPSIIYIGGLRKVKNVQNLIRSFRFVLKELPKAKLLIVGRGAEERRLKLLAKKMKCDNRITWVGEVPHQEVKDYLQKSWILVLPSISEGFPNVLLEAMACGVPIVATKVGGVPDVIKDGINGLLVKPRDPTALAKTIIMLLKNDELRKRMTERNKKEVQRYDLNTVIQQVEHILRKEIGE